MKFTNALLINSFYSNFTLLLARSLSNKHTNLITSLGFIIYLRSFSIHRFNFKNKINEKIINSELDNINFIFYRDSELICNSEGLTSDENYYFSAYYNYCEKLIIEKKIDLVIVHNEYKWTSAIPVHIAKKYKIATIIVERGVFRPNSTSLKIINFNSSYFKTGINIKKDGESNNIYYNALFKLNKFNIFLIYFNFLFFLFLHKIGELIKFNVKIKDRQWSYNKYISRFFRRKVICPANSKKPFIFIYLQLEEDSAFKMLSTYINNKSLIQDISKSANNLGYNCYFKVHPNDDPIKYIDYYQNLLFRCSDKYFINHSSLIISISSTALHNSLLSNKKILAHEGSIFELCSGVETFNSFNFENKLILALSKEKPSSENILNFYLKNIMPSQFNLNPFISKKNDFKKLF